MRKKETEIVAKMEFYTLYGNFPRGFHEKGGGDIKLSQAIKSI